MLQLSKHARARAREMGVPTKEVKRILDAEDLTLYPSNVKDGCCIAVAGRLCVPYDPVTHTVLTVMWKGEVDAAELDARRRIHRRNRRRRAKARDPQVGVADNR